MPKSFKAALYLVLFGVLTVYTVFFRLQPQREFTGSEVLGAKTGVNLFVEPDDGRLPLLDIINSAQREIFVEVYLLSDPDVKLFLEEADKRGVDVKVILEEHPFGGGNINKDTEPELEAAGVEVRWAGPSFALTHEKTVVIDEKIVCVLNMNLTKAGFMSNREYNACSENSEEAAEARNIFLADWEKKSYSPATSNLVVSPENSRGKLTAFLKSATKSLDVEMEVLADPQMIELLGQRAKEIPVRVILPPLSRVDANKPASEKISGERFLKSPYVHAKLIIVDGARAYLGSVNLSSQSLDRNRELGILISQPDVVERLTQIFQTDWERAE